MSDLARYCLVYKFVDVMNYSNCYISNELYHKSCEIYKNLAFMIENNQFLRLYLVKFMQNYKIYITIFEDRMYVDHSVTEGDLNDIRQWKFGQ